MRRQKTDEFAALSRRVRKEKPSDGFFHLTRREAPRSEDRGLRGHKFSEDRCLRGQKTEKYAALSRRMRKGKPSDGFFHLTWREAPRSEDSDLRGQKTEEYAALSRRMRKGKPSDGFFHLTWREAPQTYLSSVFSKNLSSETCPLKPVL
ncbi:MAG: hypothetical protein LBD06_04230 [Candidatus Accumulibacter sp.]|nr:hypothetical protein [Accumulibacter sp.]